MIRFSWNEKKAIILSYVIIAIYLSPLFLLGEDAHIRVHDNLDSNIAWYKVLHASGQWFGAIDATILQVINGLPRGAYGTEFSGLLLLHNLFPSMTAYAISQAISRIFAFLGMYLLLKTHFIQDREAWPIRVFVSLAFALTPFWPSGMLSTLGHPLALWAFLNIRARNHNWKDWLTLGLLPFYSSLVLGFFFFLFAISLLWLRDLIVKRDWNPVFLAAIVFMSIVFLAVEYRLVFSLLLSGEPTSRNEFISSRLPLWRSVRLSFTNFILGHHHVATMHTFFMLPLMLIVFYLTAGKRDKTATERLFLWFLLMNAILSVWYAFWFHTVWKTLKEHVSLFNTFNFARFHFLRPIFLYTGFALGCLILWGKSRKARGFVWGCLILQILFLLLFNEEILYRKLGAPSFRQFYAERQFNAIKERIGLPQDQYRVASIGLHPAIAQYNGFYTLDTYNNFYPLSYKHQFRQIIAKELEKNKTLKRYFDTWGGRCYLFVDELGKHYSFRKNSKKQIHRLEMNTEAFHRMGGTYLFSSVPIMNASDNQLRLLDVFDDDESAWRIYVYETIAHSSTFQTRLTQPS